MNNIINWLRLSLIRELSLNQKLHLVKNFNSPERILALQSNSLGIDSLNSIPHPLNNLVNESDVDEALSWQDENENQTIIGFDDSRYPDQLKEIDSPPILLYLIGEVDLLSSKQLAIVGSRKATMAGKQTAYRFASELSLAGLSITSGLALGIDSNAHQGTLDNFANTIAVLGSGVNRCYPKSNLRLYQSILKHGLVISEFPLNSAPKKHHFPQRNRLISGLSIGVLIVEASERSGSLITARYALNQNREVFAIPGSIYAPMSDGCLTLIQQGAKLTRTISDIFDEFSEISGKVSNNTNKAIHNTKDFKTATHQRLFSIIQDHPISFDKLICLSGLTIDQICSILLDLELNSYIEKLPGNQFIRTAKLRQ